MTDHTLPEKVHRLRWGVEVNHMQEAKRRRLKGRGRKGIGLVGCMELRRVKVETRMLKEQVEERVARDTGFWTGPRQCA